MLSPKDRATLASAAQTLASLASLGKAGLTDAFRLEARRAPGRPRAREGPLRRRHQRGEARLGCRARATHPERARHHDRQRRRPSSAAARTPTSASICSGARSSPGLLQDRRVSISPQGKRSPALHPLSPPVSTSPSPRSASGAKACRGVAPRGLEGPVLLPWAELSGRGIHVGVAGPFAQG